LLFKTKIKKTAYTAKFSILFFKSNGIIKPDKAPLDKQEA